MMVISGTNQVVVCMLVIRLYMVYMSVLHVSFNQTISEFELVHI